MVTYTHNPFWNCKYAEPRKPNEYIIINAIICKTKSKTGQKIGI